MGMGKWDERSWISRAGLITSCVSKPAECQRDFIKELLVKY